VSTDSAAKASALGHARRARGRRPVWPMATAGTSRPGPILMPSARLLPATRADWTECVGLAEPAASNRPVSVVGRSPARRECSRLSGAVTALGNASPAHLRSARAICPAHRARLAPPRAPPTAQPDAHPVTSARPMVRHVFSQRCSAEAPHARCPTVAAPAALRVRSEAPTPRLACLRAARAAVQRCSVTASWIAPRVRSVAQAGGGVSRGAPAACFPRMHCARTEV
jgi:hypothetical protein